MSENGDITRTSFGRIEGGSGVKKWELKVKAIVKKHARTNAVISTISLASKAPYTRDLPTATMNENRTGWGHFIC